MKRLTLALVIVVLAVMSAGRTSAQSPYPQTITLYMPVEYIDEGALQSFERKYNVGVNLQEFESNEEMYENVIKSQAKYDVLVPSDYMVDRLIQEGRLAKLSPDGEMLPNAQYIAAKYLGPEYDPNNEYHMPYMVGTVGILYNQRALQVSSLKDMFKCSGICLVDSERDVIGVALKMLGYSMNSTNNDELEAARQVLKDAKYNIKGYYESTEIVSMLTSQEALIGLVYSGDGKVAVDLNPNLAFIVPAEGSNKWTDAFVIPADSKKQDLAREFINYMCNTFTAASNSGAIGYTSPVEDTWSEYAWNKIMFPSDEELARCEAFTHSAEIIEKQGKIWRDIRG